MGFKSSDINVISTNGPTVTTPSSKSTEILAFQVTRSLTVAATKLILPADASVVSVMLFGSSVSNAATTATVTVTVSNNSGTVSTGTYDVKASGNVTGFFQMTSLPNLEPLPLNGDLTITAVYAETGTASSSGGPWTIGVNYVR